MIIYLNMSSKPKNNPNPSSEITAPRVRNNMKTKGGKDDWYLRKKDSKNRDQWKERKRGGKKFKPQVGIENISFVSQQMHDLSDFANMDLPDSLVRKIEGITALFINLKSCSSYTHFVSAVFLYIRDFYDSSITSQVMAYLGEIFSQRDFEPQSNARLDDPDWLVMIRNLQTNWQLVKGNKAFSQFSKLMGILVTLGLCDASSLTFSVAGFKVFDDTIIHKHLSAFDLMDALFGTVTYFAEGAYLCFKSGSIKPLLLNDFTVLELDEEYTNILCWWDLVKNGNLEKLMGISDNEFTNRLAIITVKLSALMSTLKGFDKKLISDKVIKCKQMQQDLITLKISSGVRKSPFAIELFGDSNQGKTTFGDQLLDILLTSADLPTCKTYRAALNAGDKYFSNWTSDKLVAILDDLANEKSSFVEKPPTRAIIDICNNQMYYAPKAEIDAKGKCFVEPEIVLVTTNKKDLDAYIYSNCPYSVQRRMELVMTVQCKPEFQKYNNGVGCGVNSDAVRLFYTVNGVYTPPLVDDIWNIKVEVAIKPEGGEEAMVKTATYHPITWRGKDMSCVSALEAIQCAVEFYSTHRINQAALMESKNNRADNLTKCHIKGCIHMEGLCPDHESLVSDDSSGNGSYTVNGESETASTDTSTITDENDSVDVPNQPLERQWGLQTAVALEYARKRIVSRFTKDSETFGGKIEDVVTRTLYKKTNKFLEKWDWVCLIPSEYIENPQVQEFFCWYYEEEIKYRKRSMSWICWLLILYGTYNDYRLGIFLFLMFLLGGFIITKSRTKAILLDELRSRNDTLPEIIKNTRDKYAKALCCGCAAIAALYIMGRVYRNWKNLPENQGALEPKNEQEVKQRDAESNVWAKVCKRVLPTTDSSKSCTIERLSSTISKNLLYASVETGGETLMANVLMLDSNVLLIPNHYFDNSDTLLLTCRKENAEAIGGKFVTRICKTASVHIPDTDFTVCFSSTGGSFKNIIKFFPEGDIVDHPFRIIWRKRDGAILEAKGLAVAQQTSNGACTFDGGEYRNLTINTFGGMCGATLLSETKSPCVTGLHLGGREGTPRGCFGSLTIEQINDAIEDLKEIDGVLKTGSGEKFTPQMYGKNLLTNEPLHPKSALNYLPDGSQFEYFGSCPGGSTSRSDVRRTPISTAVTEVTGVENIWGAPKMKPEWFGWQTALSNSSVPGIPFPHSLLLKSVRDYAKPLLLLASKAMWQSQPLSEFDNLNGRVGCKFIDAINLATSPGVPLTGTKRALVIEHPPTEDKPCNRELTPAVILEINRLREFYKRGERAYTMAKACKKDEIIVMVKGKCRIFYGNQLAFTFLIREFFLPVIRFLQMNPLVAECAVGINCHSPEWDEFYTHATKFGTDRLFGGDYGKYDQKIPSQLLLASLRILIDIARAMGYSEEDLAIMEAMSGDLVYALIAYNGDLVGIQSGMHISGNSLTVILNGICGSLNLRNFFYTEYPNAGSFREAASMMTYGDDNIGSVSPEYSRFNIKGCSEFLAEYGQIYTMPDKESALTEYLDPSEFEFLKRTNVYHPDLKCNIGALVDKSIYKSLHCYLRPKKAPLTPLEACAQNVDNGLREWFNHGRDKYEEQRAKMKIVAEKTEISHICTLLDEAYDDRVRDWREKYDETTSNENDSTSFKSGL